MNPVRLAMMVTGMGLVLIAVAVAYFGTDLRHHVPVGILAAVLLLMGGLFIFALVPYFRSRNVEDGYARRTRYVEDLPPTATTSTTVVRDRPMRRSRMAAVDDLDREVTEEHIETRRTY